MTITEQGKAQLETEMRLGYPLSEEVEFQTEALFEQAIAQALDIMLPKVNTVLEQIAL